MQISEDSFGSNQNGAVPSFASDFTQWQPGTSSQQFFPSNHRLSGGYQPVSRPVWLSLAVLKQDQYDLINL